MKNALILILLIIGINGYSQDAGDYLERAAEKELVNDYKGAMQEYDKAIKVDPNMAKAYFLRGMVKYNLSDYKEATKDYNKAIELYSKEEKFYPNMARAYYYRGMVKTSLSDYRGAIQDFSKVIELDSFIETENDYVRGTVTYYFNEVEVYHRRGEAKTKLSDLRGAILDYTKVIEIDPKDFIAYNNRGLYKAQLSDLRGGILDLDKAIELNPKNGSSYYYRGRMKIGLEKLNEGCLDLSKAGELGYEGAYDTIKEFCN